jgi:hypothetical protein
MVKPFCLYYITNYFPPPVSYWSFKELGCCYAVSIFLHIRWSLSSVFFVYARDQCPHSMLKVAREQTIKFGYIGVFVCSLVWLGGAFLRFDISGSFLDGAG